MAPQSDVVVVGAGLTGAATAWALSRAGHSVVVFDAYGFGHDKGSSHGTSRIFRRVYPDALYIGMTGRALEGWRKLEADSGARLLQVRGGIDHGSRRDPQALAAVAAEHRLAHELLSPAEAQERWPGMVFDGPVLFQPDAGVVDADASLAAFLDVARRNGACLMPHTPVEAIEVRDDHVLVHAGEPVRARRVVLAAGGWLPELLDSCELGIPLPPVQVTQQQVFHFRQRDPQAVFPVLVYKEDHQIFGLPSGGDGGPRAAMKIARHDGGTPTTASTRSGLVDAADRRLIVDYVDQWLPGLVPDPVAEGTCLYTMTDDDDFILDRRGPVVVASPCSGHGAKFAPLLGEIITDLALGRAEAHPRFALRRDRDPPGTASRPPPRKELPMNDPTPPVQPSLLADQVYAALHQSITNGTMPAGTRLRVRDVAARMGTSVMPVREAIRRLEETGLAIREPHKGAVVKGFTRQELIHVYDVRLLLETEAARHGVEGLDAQQTEQMAKECAAMRAAAREGRILDALDHDETLLTTLYAAGGNPVLTETVRNLWHQCRAYKVLGATAADQESDSSLWSYQLRLIEAVRRRDPATAADLTRQSLLSARSRIQTMLDQEAAAP
jgi:monomeric sarcosine oxidase